MLESTHPLSLIIDIFLTISLFTYKNMKPLYAFITIAFGFAFLGYAISMLGAAFTTTLAGSMITDMFPDLQNREVSDQTFTHFKQFFLLGGLRLVLSGATISAGLWHLYTFRTHKS